MRHIYSCTLLLLSIVVVSWNLTAQQTARMAAPYSGSWSGQWSNEKDYIYLADMTLRTAGNGGVEGQIVWTLFMSPLESDDNRIGLTATEFVRGSYDTSSKILTIEGYSKDDPQGIIGLDLYKLILAENGAAMGGITRNNNTWRGLIGFSRAGN